MTVSALNLLYVHANHIGYGRLGMKLAAELEKMGITVFDQLEGSDDNFDWDGGGPIPLGLIDDGRVPHSAETIGPDRRVGRANVVCWITVPAHGTRWLNGQIPMVFTMWEGMSLPEGFRESLHEFDTIIVPSMQNVELFSQYHDNVRYVPLGIDPDDWHFQERPEVRHEFRFLIAGSGKRKGADLAVEAFKRLWPRGSHFGDRPRPTLTHKSPKGEVYYGERLQTISGYLPRETEIALYANAHCYLQPSRGEGFGLQPLQAMAQGCPTILTDAHGHAAFSSLGIPIGWGPCQSDYFIFGDAGDWWEPNFDDLCDRMKDVYENYDGHRERAAANSEIVRKEFTYERTAEQLLDAIGRERIAVPYSGDGEWYEVESKKYRVVVAKDHYCEIAGASLQFYAGKEYWQSANIKRILFEAGKLDPCCVKEEDTGLSPEQVAKLGKYVAEHETCAQCGQRLPERV